MPDPRIAGERVAAILAEIEQEQDTAARDKAEELVRLLMELYGAGIEHLLRAFDRSEGDRARLDALIADDELISGLLALHDLHPETTEARVERALERVRAHFASSAAPVELLGVEGATVRLRVGGEDGSCSTSGATLRKVLESAVEEAAPEVDTVEIEGLALTPAPTPADDLIALGSRTAKG